jgi:hypothetical protein
MTVPMTTKANAEAGQAICMSVTVTVTPKASQGPR